MPLKFEVSALIPASPQEIYKAWLDSKEHGKMTGAKAKVSAKVGGSFEAWDGYISGKNIKVVPGKKIVQSWRTSEFVDGEPDSRLEVIFESAKGGTKLICDTAIYPSTGCSISKAGSTIILSR